jgi:hypothetical protein
LPYEDVSEYLEELIHEVDELTQGAKLPVRPNHSFWNKILLDIYRNKVYIG